MTGLELEKVEKGAPTKCARCGKDMIGLSEGTVVVQEDDNLDEFAVYCDKLCSMIRGQIQ